MHAWPAWHRLHTDIAVWMHQSRESESLNVTFRCVCDALGSVASCGAAYSPFQEARGT